jgi:L-ascorbate metabolism protein UlaG (beta-lactamase superfamily)
MPRRRRGASTSGHWRASVRLRLIRHATLELDYGGRSLLVDPMLDPAGARGPVANTPNDRRNPLVELPEPAEEIAARAEIVLVTHLHADHLDDTAVALLAGDCPVLCQPEDAATLRERGFTDVRPVEDALEWRGVHIARTPACHGTGEIGKAMAPASGFVLRAAGEPSIYIAGDTVWCDEVRATLDVQRPDIVVVNAGGARFTEGDPIVMTADDVVALSRHVPGAPVVAVHLDAINHCLESRAELRARLRAEGLEDRVSVPEDGEVAMLARTAP